MCAIASMMRDVLPTQGWIATRCAQAISATCPRSAPEKTRLLVELYAFFHGAPLDARGVSMKSPTSYTPHSRPVPQMGVCRVHRCVTPNLLGAAASASHSDSEALTKLSDWDDDDDVMDAGSSALEKEEKVSERTARREERDAEEEERRRRGDGGVSLPRDKRGGGGAALGWRAGRGGEPVAAYRIPMGPEVLVEEKETDFETRVECTAAILLKPTKYLQQDIQETQNYGRVAQLLCERHYRGLILAIPHGPRNPALLARNTDHHICERARVSVAMGPAITTAATLDRPAIKVTKRATRLGLRSRKMTQKMQIRHRAVPLELRERRVKCESLTDTFAVSSLNPTSNRDDAQFANSSSNPEHLVGCRSVLYRKTGGCILE
ncbi:hypothetical protein C8J57DRAFT_1244086 [Mycena rebaudengoi]|nr:hypothetical protein C8J57DRAFT_1244086 [Mycena rebaudengoi]